MEIETQVGHTIESSAWNLASYILLDNGIISGVGNSCAITVSGSTGTIGTGLVVVDGKNIVFEGTETFTVPSGAYKVYLNIDNGTLSIVTDTDHINKKDNLFLTPNGTVNTLLAEYDGTNWTYNLVEKGSNSLLDIEQIRPVGSVILLTNDTNPNFIYENTTWVMANGGFMLATCANTDTTIGTYTGTANGNASTSYNLNGYSLTVNDLPVHNHSIAAHNHPLGQHQHTAPAHNHSATQVQSTSGGFDGNVSFYSGSGVTILTATSKPTNNLGNTASISLTSSASAGTTVSQNLANGFIDNIGATAQAHSHAFPKANFGVVAWVRTA